MIKFNSFQGTVTMISDFPIGSNSEEIGCYKLMSVDNGQGALVNFVVSPTTYFVDHVIISVGDVITGFYDENTPTLMIYPPQYQAIIITKTTPYPNVKVGFFDSQLTSSDGQLKLHISSNTQLLLRNDQLFTGNPANRNLIVIYGPTTRSIPAQTTPFKVIVWC